MGLLTVVGSVGGASGAFNLLTQSPAHAAGSTLPLSTPLAFEDSDGNMVCDGTGGGAGCTGTTPNYLDWASSYVTSSPAFLNEPDTDPQCPAGSDEIFSQGTKEDSTTPTVACSPSPPKVNLTQAYAWHQTVGSDTFLYLSWEAPNQSGSNNNHIDFELNQASQTAPPTGGGTWTLNRTKGDLLFDFDITPTAPEVCYQVWDPTLNSGAGGWGTTLITNPTFDTNCTAKNNEAVLSGAQAGIAATGFTDPINSAVLPAGGFGEMGIDLTTAGLFTPGSCTNFANVWVKGRSSGSGGTSELKSFIPPVSKPLSDCQVTTQLSATTTTVGTGVTDQASLSGGTPAAGDSVTYNVYSGSDATACTGSTVFSDTEAVTSSTIPASKPFVPQTSGSFEWQAVYTQKGSTSSVASACGSEPLTVNKAPSSTATSAAGTHVLGGTATDTATVTGVKGGPTPTGTVNFYWCYNATTSPTSCNSSGTALGGNPYSFTSSGTDGSGNPTASVTSGTIPLANAGDYCFFSSYSGDGAYLTSSDTNTTPECFTVNPASTTTATQTSGDVTLSPTGSATDTANIFSTGGVPVASGDTVQFYVCKVSSSVGQSGTCATVAGNALGSPVTVSSGTPASSGTTSPVHATSISYTPTAVGSYCFSAVFSGDNNYSSSTENGSGTPVPAECFSVNPASTTTVTQTSGDVTLSPTGSATDTANIFSTGGVPVASGDTVQFYVCKVSSSVGQVGSCSNVAGNALGSAVTVSSGTPASSGTTSPVHATSPTFTPTSVGSYCFSAVFSGDSNYSSSNENTTGSGIAAECFSVSPAATSVVTATSGDVTLSPTGSATDTANVFSTGGVPVASGDTVQFYVCKVSSSVGQSGTCATVAGNALGSAVTVSSGTPASSGTTSPVHATSPTFTPTSVGSYCFSAVFSGDVNYLSSTENGSGTPVPAECFSVNPASTSTTTTASGNVTLSPTGSATDTANIFSTGGVPLASGDTVQFYVCKVSSSVGQVGSCAATAGNADGSPVAVSGTPSASGTTSAVQATSPTVTPTSAGSYCFSAVFNASGDPNYTGSSENTSGPGVAAECFSVAPASTTTTTQTSGTVTLNPSGTAFDTATISSDGGVPLAAGDTVQFYFCQVSSATGVVGSCAATAGNADGSPVAVSGTPQPSGSNSPLTVQSPTETLTAPGSYCFSAVFSAPNDTNYLGSSENTTGSGVASECFNVLHSSFTVQKTDDVGNGNPVNPGGTLNYTVTITNTGDGTGSATITDNAPSNETVSAAPVCGTVKSGESCVVNGSGNDWTIDVTLAAGDSVQVTFSAVVSATDTTDVVNTASITSGNCTTDCSSTVTNPVPNISVAKSVSPASGTAVFPGDTLTYTLTVTNNGSGTGTETVHDAAPANTTLVAGSAACGSAPAGGSCSVTSPTGTLGWSVTLPAGSSMEVTFQVKVNANDTATITNFGTFTGPGCTSESCSTNTVNNPVIVLSAVKDSTPAPGSTVNLTQTVTYSITLSNAGTGTASGVTLTDAIPTGTSYVAGSASCGGAPGCSVSESNGTVTWKGLNVAPGANSAITVTFQVTVNSTDTNGQVISNFGVFTNEGTPGCTGATCNTNTVTLTVVVPATTPTTPPSTIPAATTVHTGEPWAGARPLEILAFGLGLVLIGIGEIERRRARRVIVRRHAD